LSSFSRRHDLFSFLSFLTRASEPVILSAAGAKDLLLDAPKQVLRYARVPRASLRMTGWRALL